VLLRKAPGLTRALVTEPNFGRPGHALFALLPGVDRKQAAERFLACAAKDSDYAWTSAVVQVVSSLPAERAAAVLRPLWGKAGVDEAILPILCREPQPADRDKFLQGLADSQLETVRRCLAALEKLPPLSAEGCPAVLRCLRRLPVSGTGRQLRERLVHDLERWTGQSDLGNDPAAWEKWLRQKYPALATQWDGPTGTDLSRWRGRLARLHWNAGDATRGRLVFVRARCASCHSGASAMGPDLRGVTARFSRADLFTAILLPSRDISARYRTLLVETQAGKTYQGLVVYESTDGVLLQTAPDTTVRLRGGEIASRRFTDVSMMPPGLLDNLTDREVADLYAYLRTLGKAHKESPARQPARRT
ncbi:MAG TPA: hypothetical protein VFA18_23095, partial [Gemmataceae bacterium]|nr:hypothetical protein [Gemmataceae bacterium]